MGTLRPILIVDDDHDVRNGIADILEDEGHAIRMAANGQEALDLLRSGVTPALILLDLMMPVMDGETFCETWRQDPVLSPIPVVLVSADSSIATKAARCGATDFMTKPMQLKKLLQLVQLFTSSSRGPERLPSS